MHLILATCLTNHHAFLAKEALAESLRQLHITTNEDLIKAYQLAIDPLALADSNAVFTSGIGLSAPVEALKICVVLSVSRASSIGLQKLGIDEEEEIDGHVFELVELLNFVMEDRFEENDRPGARNVWKWISDNCKPKDIATGTLSLKDRLLAVTSFSTQPELIVDMEILHAISTGYTAEAEVQKSKLSIFEALNTSIACAKELRSSIKSSKESFNHSVYFSDSMVAKLFYLTIADWEAKLHRYVDPDFQRDNRSLRHPWIAGLETFEMCNTAALVGSMIAVQGQLIVTILHSYNAARHLLWLPENTVLEKLCNYLELAIFREPRPSSRFGSCFDRLAGSKFETKSNPLSATAVYRKAKIAHGIPVSEPRTLSNSRTYNLAFPKHRFVHMRSTLADISLTYPCQTMSDPKGKSTIEDIKRLFRPEGTMREHWARIEKHLSKQKLRPEEVKNETSARMIRYRRVIEPKFTGELPVAGINYLSLFSACEKVLRKTGVFCQ